MTAVAVPSMRLSTVRDCPRRAVAEATGAPERDLYDSERRIMFRGKSLGRDWTVMAAATHGWKVWVDSGPDHWLPAEYRAESLAQADAVAEMRVRWPFGVGHADLWIPETRTVVEVLSSAHASEEMRRSKLLQAVLYVNHLDDAEHAALIVLNPSDLSEDRTVVVGSSRLFADLLTEGRDRVAQVREWSETGTLPARVCGRPSDARSHFCRHTEWCFEGWEPPTLEDVGADEDLIAAVAAFNRAKQARAPLAAQDRELETLQKQAQAVIEQAELPAGMELQVGPFKVKRTAVQRQPIFEVAKAESAGVFEPGLYGEFMKPGASYSTFKVELVGDAPTEDYGSEAPWDEADLEQAGGLH